MLSLVCTGKYTERNEQFVTLTAEHMCMQDDQHVPVVLSMAAARMGAETSRCRHCKTAMYCRASGVSGGGACTEGPTGEGNSPTKLVIQVLGSSGLRPTDTPANALAQLDCAGYDRRASIHTWDQTRFDNKF